MVNLTTFLKLRKDKKTDAYRIDVVNENLDKIDKGVENLNTKIDQAEEKIESIELTDLKVKVTTDGDKTLDKVLKAIKNSIGALTSLKTNEKNSTVGAINEVFDTTTNLKEAEILDRKDIVKLQNELSGEVDSIHLNNIEFARLLGVDINEIERSV